MYRAAALIGLLTLAPAASAQTAAPRPNVGIDQRLNQQVPLDLTFRDEAGKPVALRQYFDGKPVILVLAWYRCPRLCSVVLTGLADGLRKVDYEIGREFTVVTVSIDPRETAELAAANKATYAARYDRPGAGKGWHFLTGEDPAIKQLAAAVGFRYFYDTQRQEYAHESAVMIVTPDGKLARYFYGIDYPASQLRFGLEDASQGKIGSPVTRPLRLLCFDYDPAVGKYTFMTLRLVRVVSGVCVLALFIWLIRGWWRGPRSRTAPAGGG